MDREHATALFDDKVAGADWLDDLFVGPLSHWRGKLVWDGPAGATAAAELGEHHRFSAVIDRFQAAQGGPDRIAATSFWSQIYFSTLIVPAVVASLGLARNLRLGWSDMHVTLCPRSGVPLHFGMTPDRAPTLDTPLLHPLFEGHLTPFIAMVRRESGLSSRLLWENAGWILVWILGEMAPCLPSGRAGHPRRSLMACSALRCPRRNEARHARRLARDPSRLLPPLPRPGLRLL
ncbi:siderophore-iron reductase FhuF [Lichenifustis flavocetrariae]|uniref:Siderophore-iron reductase FhuF n=1 Tax=Lichenifustis flavocetrariae TaxID=2949735 RepID=A0AA41Z4P0_9HYPH|nr:siderophore-iron reductase FhuF [Lichenifustis flavocetrariae]MCW6509207.1 siderophore-iron reductase FhuF [Lichenifustis flavocetrariae]